MNNSISPEESADKAALRAYNAAIRLLARRDHSVFELTCKLKRQHGESAIEAALEELVSANYVNDARYAERYAEQRMNQGYGPLSIRSKLASKGLDSHRVQNALQQLQVDWSKQAESAILKRFAAHDIVDAREQATARIARFLQGRGFIPSDSLRALKRIRKALSDNSTF